MKKYDNDYDPFLDGDEYATNDVSRADLDKVIDLLTTAGIAFYINEEAKTIAFDITVLHAKLQWQVAKLLNLL